MKIIPASYEIMPSDMPLLKRLEICGRVPYKSEDKIEEGSAEGFVGRMFARNHRPVFDMAAVHVFFPVTNIDNTRLWVDCFPGASKYLQVSFIRNLGKITCLMSGSIRAWIEYIERHTRYVEDLKKDLFIFSPECFPMFANHQTDNDETDTAHEISTTLPEYIEIDFPRIFKKHHYVGVKFIVNRAVSHELVRHRPCGFLQESQRYCIYIQEKFGNEVTFIDPAGLGYTDEQMAVWKLAMQYAECSYLRMIKNGANAQQARTVLPNSCKTEIVVYCTLEQWEHVFSLRRGSAADPSMREVMVPLGREMREMYQVINLDKKPYIDEE